MASVSWSSPDLESRQTAQLGDHRAVVAPGKTNGALNGWWVAQVTHVPTTKVVHTSSSHKTYGAAKAKATSVLLSLVGRSASAKKKKTRSSHQEEE